jgi:hypothetical protein
MQDLEKVVKSAKYSRVYSLIDLTSGVVPPVLKHDVQVRFNFVCPQYSQVLLPTREKLHGRLPNQGTFALDILDSPDFLVVPEWPFTHR